MEIKKFLDKYKSCKKGTKFSQQFNFKVYRKDNSVRLSNVDKCSKCGNVAFKDLIVEFNKPQEFISVFCVGMLWYLYIENKIVLDYGGFHKCIAGKRFIENIKRVDIK